MAFWTPPAPDWAVVLRSCKSKYPEDSMRGAILPAELQELLSSFLEILCWI